MRSDWSSRVLAPQDVNRVAMVNVEVGDTTFRANVVSYSLSGMRQYGVLFVPAGASGPFPVILDVRGVEPGYPARRLDDGPFSASVVTTPDQGRFAFAVPSLRGHAIELDGYTYASEGDRRDSWDGATDDAIGFLNAVLSMDEPLDRGCLAVFGASRGGSVALLMSAREPRIDAAVAFAPPTDWFALMSRPGENWLEALEAEKARPVPDGTSREAQFLEWFVQDRQALPLANARRRLLASSALYFPTASAAIQVHHGVEDRPVPVRNARALEQRTAELDGLRVAVFFHPGAGHDLSATKAPDQARRFLLKQLQRDGVSPKGVAGNCK